MAKLLNSTSTSLTIMTSMTSGKAHIRAKNWFGWCIIAITQGLRPPHQRINKKLKGWWHKISPIFQYEFINSLQIFLTKMSAGLMKSCIRIVVVHLGKHPGILGITWQENLPITNNNNNHVNQSIKFVSLNTYSLKGFYGPIRKVVSMSMPVFQ